MTVSASNLAAQIPDTLEPGEEFSNWWKIRQKLEVLDRQSLVLAVQGFFQENHEALSQVKFKLGCNDEGVYWNDEEFTETGTLSDEQVDTLSNELSNLVAVMDEENRSHTHETLKRLVEALSECSHTPKDFQDALVQVAARFIPNAEVWLGRHAAHAQAVALEGGTQQAPAPSTRPRI